MNKMNFIRMFEELNEFTKVRRGIGEVGKKALEVEDAIKKAFDIPDEAKGLMNMMFYNYMSGATSVFLSEDINKLADYLSFEPSS